MFGLVCVSDVHTLNLPVVQPWFREQEFPTPAEVLRVCSQACLMVSTASEDKPEQQLLLCFAVAITMLGSSKKMGKLDIVNRVQEEAMGRVKDWGLPCLFILSVFISVISKWLLSYSLNEKAFTETDY